MRKKVMVIDDDPMNRRLLSVILTSEGHDTVSASEGGEAIELARREMPDLILMDMCMPDVDGLKVTEMLKRDQRLAFVPVIAVTALTGDEHETRAIEGGCSDYIRKPVSVHGFIESVNRYLN